MWRMIAPMIDYTPGELTKAWEEHQAKKAINLGLMPGDLISWESPLFGLCSGRVASLGKTIAVDDEYIRVDDHEVTGEVAFVSLSWNVRRITL